jgi:hypothetical protein
MAMLDRLLQHIMRNDDVWFATHLEVAEAWIAGHPGKESV